jgi:cytochrome c biogenesis protein CcdA
VGAAFLTGPDGSQITTGVEVVASVGGTLLGNVAAALPLGYAFSAGMVSGVNPCGAAILPAYAGLYLGAGDQPGARRSVAQRLRRALQVGALVSLGFVALFGVVGVVLGIATGAIARYFPWLGLLVGILLIVGGGQALEGQTLYASFGEQVADRLGTRARHASSRGYFAYGLAYGAASLSCTLPIFLAVVGSALTVQGFLPSLFQFILYGLGMGLVLTTLTVSLAFFKHAAITRTRAVMRYVQPATAVLLLIAGAYIVYYWLTLGGLLNVRV